MDRDRIATAVLVVLAVAGIAAAGVWYLVVDTPPVAGSDLNATTPDPTVETAPAEFAMSVEVRSHSVDGSEESCWTAGVVYDADARERVGWLNSTDPDGDVVITHYQRYTSNATHNYVRYHASDPEQFRGRVEPIRKDLDPGTETLRVDEAARTYEYYREEPRSEFEIVPRGVFYAGFVHAIPFERTGVTTLDGKAMEKYVPVDGWTRTTGSVTDGPDTYISNTSGALYVDEQTGNIVRADVSLTSKRTDVRAGAWFGDGGSRVRFSLSVHEEIDDEGLKPEWAKETPFDDS